MLAMRMKTHGAVAEDSGSNEPDAGRALIAAFGADGTVKPVAQSALLDLPPDKSHLSQDSNPRLWRPPPPHP